MKSKIEWCDYTINPVKGLCPMACSYCYARRMYKRFKWNPEIRFDEFTLTSPFEIYSQFYIHKPSRIFVGSTIELFGDWVKTEWLAAIFRIVKDNPRHTFIFLTKQPQNLIKWSPFPENCWIGVTATNVEMYDKAILYLNNIKAKVKYISFEPLLGSVKPHVLDAMPHVINWVIIGACTPYSPKTAPRKEWVDEIIDAGDKAGIPIFLKNNLRPVLKNVYGDNTPMRQYFPKGK